MIKDIQNEVEGRGKEVISKYLIAVHFIENVGTVKSFVCSLVCSCSEISISL
jgi:hypothetical protein